MTTDTGEGLDKQIIERVFGRVPCQGAHDSTYKVLCYATPEDPTNGAPVPDFSTYLPDALEAAEKAKLFSNDSISLIKNSDSLWEVRAIDYQAGGWETYAVAPTVPLALCRAILHLLDAPAAPAQNSPTLIPPLKDNCFDGTPLLHRTLVRDAEKKRPMKVGAPAAPRRISRKKRK